MEHCSGYFLVALFWAAFEAMTFMKEIERGSSQKSYNNENYTSVL